MYYYTRIYPMDTSSSIHYGFKIEIPRQKIAYISSIMKGNVDSTFKIDEKLKTFPHGFFDVISM